VAFFNTAAELTRQYNQNKNDIAELYRLVEETRKAVRETNTKVDDLTTRVDGLDTKVDNLNTAVDNLNTAVANLNTAVGNHNAAVGNLNATVGDLSSELGGLTTLLDERFDQLEHLLALPSQERAASSPRPQRHNLFDAYDERATAHHRRFDALDSQMAEVLTILRAKSA
jgi:chromosome segregation ATPase